MVICRFVFFGLFGFPIASLHIIILNVEQGTKTKITKLSREKAMEGDAVERKDVEEELWSRPSQLPSSSFSSCLSLETYWPEIGDALSLSLSL